MERLKLDLIVVFLAFMLGALVERIYSARWTGPTELGASWGWSTNKVYRLLHRIYCELCPRRLCCERYKREVMDVPA